MTYESTLITLLAMTMTYVTRKSGLYTSYDYEMLTQLKFNKNIASKSCKTRKI